MKKIILLMILISANVFAGEVSDEKLKSLVLDLVNAKTEKVFNGKSLKLDTHTLVLDTANGYYTTIYAGRRMDGMSAEKFLTEMVIHINVVTKIFKDKGLVFYSFVVTRDYEIAVQTWETKELAEKAFASNEAAAMREHGNNILKHVHFEEVR